MEINCTVNNGNGCFMDSCGHNCSCEGLNFREKENKTEENERIHIQKQTLQNPTPSRTQRNRK